MSGDGDKAALRTELYARRKVAFKARADAVPAATARMIAAIDATEGRVISGYCPIRTELDPSDAMRALHEAGARLCVPVIVEAGQPLQFRVWAPDCAMVPGAFGAPIPAAGDWLEPDILITPLLGWDRHGWRLGYGGGFYDRTLMRLRGLRPTRAIGFAFAAQEVPNVPIEPTDQRLDALVTETELVEFRE